MACVAEKHSDVMVVLPQGDSLDASNAKEFKKSMESVVQENPRIVLDMSGLKFVDSSGLGALLSCLRQVNRQNGDMKLCGLSNSVRALIELVRMHRIFDIFNSKEEAVEAFHRS